MARVGDEREQGSQTNAGVNHDDRPRRHREERADEDHTPTRRALTGLRPEVDAPKGDRELVRGGDDEEAHEGDQTFTAHAQKMIQTKLGTVAMLLVVSHHCYV